MSKIAVVYWSATGNTEAMANAVAQGAREAGADAEVIYASAFDPSKADRFDAIAFGCPAMGAEVLEEDEFEPMFTACHPKLKGKIIGLFGSYDWGDGEWMRVWQDDCRSIGADLVSDGVIACNEPDDEAVAACKALGASLA